MVIKYITGISCVNELVQSIYSSFYYDCWSVSRIQCYPTDITPKTTSSCGNQEPQSPVTWGIILHVSTCRVITLQLTPINQASPEGRKEMCSKILLLPSPLLILLLCLYNTYKDNSYYYGTMCDFMHIWKKQIPWKCAQSAIIPTRHECR